MTISLFMPMILSFVFLTKLCNIIPLFPRKYKKDVYFLLTARDKWNNAKYLMKYRRGMILFYSKHKFSLPVI